MFVSFQGSVGAHQLPRGLQRGSPLLVESGLQHHAGPRGASGAGGPGQELLLLLFSPLSLFVCRITEKSRTDRHETRLAGWKQFNLGAGHLI